MQKRALIVTVCFAAAIAPFAALRALGVWVNLSSSMEPGIYREHPLEIPQRGQRVLACLPVPFAILGLERGYLAPGNCPGGSAPAGKRIAGVPGDRVEISGRGIRVNGLMLEQSAPLKRDGAGRALEGAHFSGILNDGQYVLKGRGTSSFDSRYFGAVPREDLIAAIEPLYFF